MAGRKLSGASNVRNGVSRKEFDECVQQLKARVEALEKELAVVRKATNGHSAGRNGKTVVQTISREEAREEIAKLFASGRTMYSSDVARRLHLDLKLVVELCQELQRVGVIEVARE